MTTPQVYSKCDLTYKVYFQTFDGKCLFVDKLSGDFRANLTPVQIAECNSTNGQGWDFITVGQHIEKGTGTLVVSTLTNACLDYDSRADKEERVNLYSCGGRADGGKPSSHLCGTCRVVLMEESS